MHCRGLMYSYLRKSNYFEKSKGVYGNRIRLDQIVRRGQERRPLRLTRWMLDTISKQLFGDRDNGVIVDLALFLIAIPREVPRCTLVRFLGNLGSLVFINFG